MTVIELIRQRFKWSMASFAKPDGTQTVGAEGSSLRLVCPWIQRLLPICPLQGQQKDRRNMDGFSGNVALDALIEIYSVRNFKWKWVSVYLLSKPEKKLFFCLLYRSVCLSAFRIEPHWHIPSVIFMALMILLFPEWNYYHQFLLEGLMVTVPIWMPIKQHSHFGKSSLTFFRLPVEKRHQCAEQFQHNYLLEKRFLAVWLRKMM